MSVSRCRCWVLGTEMQGAKEGSASILKGRGVHQDESQRANSSRFVIGMPNFPVDSYDYLVLRDFLWFPIAIIFKQICHCFSLAILIREVELGNVAFIHSRLQRVDLLVLDLEDLDLWSILVFRVVESRLNASLKDELNRANTTVCATCLDLSQLERLDEVHLLYLSSCWPPEVLVLRFLFFSKARQIA